MSAPVHDLGALEDAVRAAKLRAVRKKPALQQPVSECLTNLVPLHERHGSTPTPVGAGFSLLPIATRVRKVLAGEPVDETQRRLIAPDVTLGGAHPKALPAIDGAQWVLKFAEPGDVVDTPLAEHAMLTLAAKAGICVAQTRPIALQQGHAIAVKRFNRLGAQRRYALSANVALKAASESVGYPELAQLLHRIGLAQQGVYAALKLAPAFDVLPSGQALGYQQMRVGGFGADATLVNALLQCAQFGLSQPQALSEVRAVCTVIANWQAHFLANGVTAADVNNLAGQIDRPFLLQQRHAFG